jgi:hypothetical protein
MLGDRDKIYNKFRERGVRFVGFIELLNFSPTDKPVDQVHGAVDQRRGSGAQWINGLVRIGRRHVWWCVRRSRASGHSGAQELTGGGKKERGAQGSFCGPHRSSSGSVVIERWRLSSGGGEARRQWRSSLEGGRKEEGKVR